MTTHRRRRSHTHRQQQHPHGVQLHPVVPVRVVSRSLSKSLPSCSKTEQTVKEFAGCSGCRSVVYCCLAVRDIVHFWNVEIPIVPKHSEIYQAAGKSKKHALRGAMPAGLELQLNVLLQLPYQFHLPSTHTARYSPDILLRHSVKYT